MTDNYIKMCERATEIQDEWKKTGRSIGDKFIAYMGDNTGRGEILWTSHNDYASDYDIFLPSQRQLQNMVDENFIPTIIMGKFVNEISPEINMQLARNSRDTDFEHAEKEAILLNQLLDRKRYYEQFQSMEELWLAYVMHKKYNKQWNGTQWRGL